MFFNIRLAEKTIKIESIHAYIMDYCKEYLCEVTSDAEIDFTVSVMQSDIDYEREKSRAEDIKEGIPIREFSDEYLETLSVYRKIVVELLSYDTILFHGSVIAVDGVGYLFTAKSGTGKSTHTRLWREYFGERAVMVNDDKPLLQITEEGVMVYGTPWDGKHRLSTNTSVPLKTICVLERGERNRIKECDFAEIYPMLMQQVYRPNMSGKPELMMKTMELVDKLKGRVRFYKLCCNRNIDAARVAYEGMK